MIVSQAAKPAIAVTAPTPERGLGAVTWGIARSLRPAEWIKNLLVFAALVFSGKFFERPALWMSLEAFAALCLAASAGYLLNDVKDRQADRYHPTKCNRPIASGQVPPALALVVGLVLGLVAVAIGFVVNRTAGLGIVAYLLLTAGYTMILKKIVIVDVLTLAIVFVLRVIVGAEAVSVKFSTWLVLCTFLLALFLGFGKRRHELELLEDNAHPHRPVLAEYSSHFLDMMMAVVTASTVMSYILYTIAPETVAHFQTTNLIYTTVFVLYGVFRYLFLIHLRSFGGNPAQVLLRDRPLQIAVVLWIISIFLLRYF